MGILDRLNLWKRVRRLETRFDELEDRLQSLESRLGGPRFLPNHRGRPRPPKLSEMTGAERRKRLLG